MNRISVIVPIYNTASYLPTCLDSILAQRAWLKEVILVDDGSTDQSGEICDAYAAAYPQLVKVLHQCNQGAGAARNRGIDLAKGEILSFIDSDDYIAPDMYEKLLRLMDESDADMAAGTMWFEKMDKSKYCHIQERIRCKWSAREALIQLNTYRYLHVSFCCALFQRSVIGSLRFPEGERCEDYALLYQVVGRCSVVAYCSEPIYYYVQRENSASRTVNVCLAPLHISLKQLEYIERNYPDLIYIAETDCAFARIGINTAYVRRGVECPKQLLRRLRQETRKYLKSVLRNPFLPVIKKFQALMFCCCIPIYNEVIRRTEHR